MFPSPTSSYVVPSLACCWLCDCICADPLLHSGGCNVDGGGGPVHVPEDCDYVCPNHHTLLD